MSEFTWCPKLPDFTLDHNLRDDREGNNKVIYYDFYQSVFNMADQYAREC